MPFVRPFLLVPTLALLVAPAAASSAVVGDVAACSIGHPALKVRVSGFKRVAGQLRFTLYDRAGWLRKGASLKKLRVPVTGSAVEVCVAVPGPGTYGLALHHDLNADKQRDRSDGAGFSRNPRLSLMSRPSFASAEVSVGPSVHPIAIELRYLHGLTVGPARGS